jgi:integrase
MRAWVSRERRIDGKLKRTKVEPGVRGVQSTDRFLLYWLDPDGKQRQQGIAILGKPGKRLADSLAEQRTAELTLGTYQSLDKTRWSVFRERLDRDEIDLKKRTATREQYTQSLDLFQEIINPTFVNSVTSETVMKFRRVLAGRHNMRGNRISPATVNKHLRAAKFALNYAVEHGYTKELVKIRFLDEDQKQAEFMPPEEFERVWKVLEQATHPLNEAYAPKAFWEALLLLAHQTGMRRGELLSLGWEDVHLDDRWLRVRSENAKAGRNDVIPLDELVVQRLRKITHFGTQVFDWPFSARTLNDHFYRLQKIAGCGLQYGFHALKKTCLTMNARLLSEAELNAYARHQSQETTRKHYINQTSVLEGITSKTYKPQFLVDEG